jgi:hypothetical protein
MDLPKLTPVMDDLTLAGSKAVPTMDLPTTGAPKGTAGEAETFDGLYAIEDYPDGGLQRWGTDLHHHGWLI